MALGTVTPAFRGFGTVLFALLALASPVSAQQLSGAATVPPPSSEIADTLPDIHAAPLTGQQALRTAQTSEIGTTEVGQRIEKKDLTPSREPLDRIDNRIANRVDNRIDNRIDSHQDTDQGSTAAYEIATTRLRTATEATAH